MTTITKTLLSFIPVWSSGGNRAARSLGFATALATASMGVAVSANAASAPDAWITTKVKMALLVAEDVPATAVSVDTMDGNVTLYGTVSSAGEKMRAETTAKDVKGVHAVRDLLQVVPKTRQGSVAVADEELSEGVQKRLDADPALSNSKITVKSVNTGVVLLDGKAATLTDHLRALEVARATPGVKRVASEIQSPDALSDNEIWRDARNDSEKSKPSAMRDAWITTDSKVRLMANSITPAFDINVDTKGGVVTLFGTVPTEASKQAAETEVRKIAGVKNVENDLQIVPHVSAGPVEREDERVKDSIEERLEAREGLSDANIDVEVANGVARLTGSVQSQSDRLTALTLTRTTGGVNSVIDGLAVKQ
jgi:osmotically-inducible protein OsmY